MPPKRKRSSTPWLKERKGDLWSKEEEEYLDDAFDHFLSQQALEHKRTKVAILCRILKLIED